MSETVRPDRVGSREDLGRALTDLRLSAELSVRDVAAEADALVGTVAWLVRRPARADPRQP